MKDRIDPRTKLIIVLCISSLALIFTDILMLFTVFLSGLFLSIAFGGNFFILIKRLRKLLYVFLTLIIVQSIFIKSGTPILTIGNINLITDVGLYKGLAYIFRVLIIILSGSIISTSREREIVQGLVQLKLPYELAFMTSIGIKFLPLLLEEMKDTLLAIELRGINVKSLPIKKRIKMISYILTPVIANTLNKAKNISISVENRAFRVYNKRVSIVNLKLNLLDYLIMMLSVSISIMMIYYSKI